MLWTCSRDGHSARCTRVALGRLSPDDLRTVLGADRSDAGPCASPISKWMISGCAANSMRKAGLHHNCILMAQPRPHASRLEDYHGTPIINPQHARCTPYMGTAARLRPLRTLKSLAGNTALRNRCALVRGQGSKGSCASSSSSSASASGKPLFRGRHRADQIAARRRSPCTTREHLRGGSGGGTLPRGGGALDRPVCGGRFGSARPLTVEVFGVERLHPLRGPRQALDGSARASVAGRRATTTYLCTSTTRPRAAPSHQPLGERALGAAFDMPPAEGWAGSTCVRSRHGVAQRRREVVANGDGGAAPPRAQ